MIQMPAAMFPHTVQVRAYRGAGAYGPLYADPVPVRCLKAGGTKLLRDPATGDQVLANAVLYCPGGTVVPEQSLVMVDGVQRTVIRIDSNDAGGMPVPASVVVYAQ